MVTVQETRQLPQSFYDLAPLESRFRRWKDRAAEAPQLEEDRIKALEFLVQAIDLPVKEELREGLKREVAQALREGRLEDICQLGTEYREAVQASSSWHFVEEALNSAEAESSYWRGRNYSAPQNVKEKMLDSYVQMIRASTGFNMHQIVLAVASSINPHFGHTHLAKEAVGASYAQKSHRMHQIKVLTKRTVEVAGEHVFRDTLAFYYGLEIFNAANRRVVMGIAEEAASFINPKSRFKLGDVGGYLQRTVSETQFYKGYAETSWKLLAQTTKEMYGRLGMRWLDALLAWNNFALMRTSRYTGGKRVSGENITDLYTSLLDPLLSNNVPKAIEASNALAAKYPELFPKWVHAAIKEAHGRI